MEQGIERPVAGTKAYWSLLALAAGLFLGALAREAGDDVREPAIRLTGFIGELWLDALKMTVIPLIVALLFIGISKGAEAAKGGRIATQTVFWVVGICTSSAIFGAIMTPTLLQTFPLPEAASSALRAGLQALDPAAASAPVPAVSDFFRNIIPANVVEASANGDVLPLVVFALLLALASTRISPDGRAMLTRFFQALADALLVLIGWVLFVAPIGILALSFTLGASAGGGAFAGLLHYILVVSGVGLLFMLFAYPIAIFLGRIPAGRFARGMIAPQAIAVSTRSSLASLPAMLAASQLIGIRERVADIALPVAVALFRATGPAMNIAVALYVAHWLGIEPGIGQIVAATMVAAVISYGSVSLPGEISFLTSIAPIAMALGVPIAPLALLVAVEMIPDIVRTLGNVTMDVAVTATVDRDRSETQPATD